MIASASAYPLYMLSQVEEVAGWPDASLDLVLPLLSPRAWWQRVGSKTFISHAIFLECILGTMLYYLIEVEASNFGNVLFLMAKGLRKIEEN